MLRLALAIVVTTAMLAAAGAASGAGRPGSIETRIARFGNEQTRAIRVAPDGRIVVAGASRDTYPGHSWVRVYLPDGRPDRAFGHDGNIDFENDWSEILGLAVQPDGRILVAQSGAPSRLHRLNRDGSLDTTFGAGGTLFLSFGNTPTSLTDLVLQPDGRILVSGVGWDRRDQLPPSHTNLEVDVERYLPDGSPDPEFGTNGRVTLPRATAEVQYARLALQPSGEIVLALTMEGPEGFSRLSTDKLARMSTSGVLDADFGGGGVAAVEFAAHLDPADAYGSLQPLILSDGRIRLLVTVADPQRPGSHLGSRFGLVGLTAHGHPNLRFGERGLALGPPRLGASGWEQAEIAITDTRGGILVAGSIANDNGDIDAGIIRRFLPDGRLDRSFGRRGLVRGPLPGGGYSAFGHSLAMLDADTVVVGEYVFDGKYGFWDQGLLRTLHAGYDDSGPSISLVRLGCRSVRVRIRDLSGMDGVVVRAHGRVVRRTTHKRFRVRLPAGSRRVVVRAVDLAGHLGARGLRLPPC